MSVPQEACTPSQKVLEFLFQLEAGEIGHQTIPVGAKIGDVNCRKVLYDGDYALVYARVTFEFNGEFHAIEEFEAIISL